MREIVSLAGVVSLRKSCLRISSLLLEVPPPAGNTPTVSNGSGWRPLRQPGTKGVLQIPSCHVGVDLKSLPMVVLYCRWQELLSVTMRRCGDRYDHTFCLAE